MKKTIKLLVTFICIFIVTGCSNKEDGKKVFQIGFTTAPVENDPYYIFAKTFSDIVKEKTDGNIVVDIKGSGQLGQEGEMFTGMQIGTTDMAIMTNAYISGYIPQAGLFDLPFIFKDGKEAAQVLDGKLGDEILKGYEEYGIKGLAYGEGGFRHLVTLKSEVRKPEDFKGLKIRCMETDTYIATYQELGTNAVPMAWSETITGLQQGTIDGLDIPVSVIYTNGFADIAKDLNMTGHFYSPLILCISKNVYDELEVEEQRILKEAAIEAGEATRISNKKTEPKMLDEMKRKGMKVIKDVDKESFQKSFEDFYDKRAEEIGKEYLDELRLELNL
ncbi:MAG: TRAP transporter substrate-binding protein [Peptoniphilus lacydonensis]|uniref:TRAP transporter substrate-binding protein n=1 Tax=Peptoniphilaceae TaxID=1570339 RepID=UPI0029044AED|nr:TRAP transporter substrate-binding protein [Peptoniphilus lacydonensis]MDU1954849.1 TRAP transporter substrate-binding protein [Peptoniphilus lacydonensis]MDU2114780.1 TRAP transporter substrate-binding protein [Peptoniphilus lacydonensis]MDU5274344.1 TRAP transporter substrate-binding protein [Peptoniphilus lacydonensis]